MLRLQIFPKRKNRRHYYWGFWGLSSGNLLDREKSGLGVSIILCSSEKGVSLIKNSSSNFIIEKHDISETFKFNPRLLSPVIKNDYVKKFRQSFEKTKISTNP